MGKYEVHIHGVRIKVTVVNVKNLTESHVTHLSQRILQIRLISKNIGQEDKKVPGKITLLLLTHGQAFSFNFLNVSVADSWFNSERIARGLLPVIEDIEEPKFAT
ncbi:hypothetical protein ACFE04_028121 [Oxalis oulophora]